MEMHEMATFQQPEEIIQPFTISCVGETMIVCTKEHTLVMQLRYKHIMEDGAFCYELSRIKCSPARPTGALFTHEPTLYNASNMEQRKQMMLDQTIFPNIAKVHVSNVQSWISPCGIFQDEPKEQLIANLNNMGQLSIYRQEQPWLLNWNVYVDVSDTWQSHIYDNHRISSFEELQTMVGELTVTCFSWDSEPHRYPMRFAFGTKSGKLVLCSLLTTGPKIEHVHQEEAAIRIIKYLSIGNKNLYVLVGIDSGRVGMFRFGAKNITHTSHHLGTFFNEDLPISAMEYEIDEKNQQLLILVVKATYVLALLVTFDGGVLAESTLNLENFMITGLQQLAPLKYLVSTLPGSIFHIFVKKSAKGFQLVEEEVKTDMSTSPYGLYGIAATRTRACWFLLGYPTKRFDHLSLRSPTSIFFARFNKRDPLNILQENPSLKMEGYYDAAEVIRFNGNKNTETLKPLEDIDLNLSLSASSMYQLKLQLVQIGAKISFHSKRNKTVAEILHNQLQFICSLIEVISACKIILGLADRLIHMMPLNPLQQTAFRCLRNFIRIITNGSFPGDYEYLHAELKPRLLETLAKADSFAIPESYELCSFCDFPIDPEKLTCPENHPVPRCVLTKIQIPLDRDEVTCVMCQRYAIDQEQLELIFDQTVASFDYRQCCICDAPFSQVKMVQ